VPDDAPLKVGDFVVIRGERLGRIERGETDGYAVRALMPHRRWAVHTSTRSRDELDPAGHDYVRAKLGLEVGAAATVSMTVMAPGSLAGGALSPRDAILRRASPAAERSLAARVLTTTTALPPPAPVVQAAFQPDDGVRQVQQALSRFTSAGQTLRALGLAASRAR